MTSDAQREADNLRAKRFYLMNTSDPAAFAKSLFEFGSINNINNLVQAFDAYADSGATYNNQSIKNIPQLKKLYMQIKSNPRMFSETEIGDMLEVLF
jgi:hypothetical protein